nr:RNA-directed DNA polymerase, eukaryota [Tanacetum cinerariifolium]
MGNAVSTNKVQRTPNFMGCLTLKPPFSYLGVKVGAMMSRINYWDDIVGKLRAHLSKWKMKNISIGGRLRLLKSVLASISIYHLSMFKVPAKVLHTMESIRSHFFIGADIDDKKMIWVSWSNVLASKHNGGLGISSFYTLNRALMFKWVWLFRTQNSSLWSKVISAIHGERKPRKGQNRIKTGQKREAWRSREKLKAVAVDKGRKTEENAKRMVENAYTVKKLFKL